MEYYSRFLDRFPDLNSLAQAVMELGALVCTPRTPDCQSCPLRENCHAYAEDRISELPQRSRPAAKRLRHFNYLVICQDDKVFLGRRQ